MINQSNFLDLKDIYVYELIGDVWLFLFLGIIVLFYLSSKFKIPYQATLLFGLLWGSLVFSIAYQQMLLIWIIIVAIAGVSFYYIFSKAIK